VAATIDMDPQPQLGSAFARSLAFHVFLFGGLSAWAWLHKGIALGDPNAGGTAVGIEAVSTIPIPPRSGPPNPVANDTDNETPPEPIEKPAPKATPKPEPKPDKDAISLKTEKQTKQPLVPKQRLKSFNEIASNQLTAKSPQALTSPLYSQGGAGRIGSNLDTTLGTKFPAYAARVQEVTRQNWRTQDVDRSISIAPPVTIQFEILKDGRVDNVRLIRRSGIPSLDDSVRNAIETAQYPKLPDGYDRSSVPVEFTFELKR